MTRRVVICQYIRLLNREGVFRPGSNYQNLFIGESRTHLGNVYKYAPYKIVGNGSIRGGDSMRATLTTIPNKLTIPLTTSIVLENLLIQVNQVFVTVTPPTNYEIGPVGDNFEDVRLLNSQVWACVSCNRDNEKISLILASPLDAFSAHAPRRVYTNQLIGRAPTTGFISGR